jgi:hypothetical protein
MTCSCTTNSVVVGSDKKYGSLYRCKVCHEYWVIQSDRLWEDEIIDPEDELIRHEGIPEGYSPVFRGRGELGLANSILIGSTVDCRILNEAIA